MSTQNPFDGARSLQLTADTKPILDSLGSNRFYQFTLRQRSSISLALTGLDGDANLSLKTRLNQTLSTSANTGTQSESIQTTIEAGTYYIQITPASNTPVQFQLTAQVATIGTSNFMLYNASSGELASALFNNGTLIEKNRDSMRDPNWSIVDRGNYDPSTPEDEILWRNSRTGELAFWQRSGNRIVPVYLPTVSDLNWQLKQIVDLDGDGDRDLVWRNNRTGETALWQMNGMTFEQGSYLPAADKTWDIAAAYDIDGDGDPDLLWQNNTTGEIAWWQMNGATFERGIYLPTVPQGWKIEGTIDFDGDGERDLVWRHDRTGETALWQMKNAKLEKGVYLLTVSDRNWQIKGFNDFSGDRRPDILWQNEQTGEVGYWEIQDFKYVRSSMIQTGLIGSKDWRIVSPRDRLVDPTPIPISLPAGAIEGIQWNDLNGNGIREDNEPGLADWTIYLDSNKNDKLDAGERSTKTDQTGRYYFRNLEAGTYTVAAITPTSWSSTTSKTEPQSSSLIGVKNYRDLVFDAKRQLLYITTDDGDLERFDIKTNTLLTPWDVGYSLNGADITADGNALYVAEAQRGATTGLIRKVDLNQGAVTEIPYALNYGEGGAWDVKLINDRGFISTTYNGSGDVPFRELDLKTDKLSVRQAPAYFGEVNQNTFISRSADRSFLLMTEPNSSAGPAFTFDAATNRFPNHIQTQSFLDQRAAVNRNGTLVAIGSSILDRALKPVEVLNNITGATTFDPTQDILYGVNTESDQVIAYDTNTWRELFRFKIGENIENSSFYSFNRQLLISDDGQLMFVGTNSGVRTFKLKPAKGRTIALADNQVVRNINFGSRQEQLQPNTISGLKWNDSNRNGIKDGAESVLSGWTIYLDQNQNNQLDSGEVSTVTDSNGRYTFSNLATGEYTIAEIAPAGWQSTTPETALIAASNQRDLIYDAQRNRFYITTSDGKVERYDIATRSLLTPINVSTTLAGGDITSDGSALYVAVDQTVGGQAMIRKVNLDDGSVKNLTYTLNYDDLPSDLAIDATGTAIIRGRGQWQPVRQLNTKTDTFSGTGSIYGGTVISRGVDRSLLVFTEDGISSGEINTYDPATGKVGEMRTNTYLRGNLSAVNRNGSLIAIEFGNGVSILNRSLATVKTLANLDGGIVFDPTKDVLYAADSATNQIIAYSTNTWAELSRITIGEDIAASVALGAGMMSISDDGKYLMISTTSGVRMLSLSNPEKTRLTVSVRGGQTVTTANLGSRRI